MGPTGPTGPAGEDGTASTVQVGTVQTGDPGTEAAVTNSGTNQNAILDFVIPQGQPGTSGTPELLATSDTAPQPSTANQALTFQNNDLVSGTAITHQTGSGQVSITQPGIYQAQFHGVTGVASGSSVPATVGVSFQLNGSNIPGGATQEIFTDSGQYTGMSVSVPFSVTSTPATLTVVPSQSGFTFSDLGLSVQRLGDASADA